ncbi:hypothetical protein [Microbacterium sp. NPDC058389]|uniref:hypothetical protein n=1 Tax=Microbacterium sp. NPDC058389 TaxID=3346475 RepID=UPI0036463774
MADDVQIQVFGGRLAREFGSFLAHDPYDPEAFWTGAARALISDGYGPAAERLTAGRTNHLGWAAEFVNAALDAFDPNEPGTRDEATVAEHLALAQVHATLALVEQKRIENLIALAGWVADADKESVGIALDELRVGVAGEIWEGLGL